ncbi:MAG: DUF998 domain-containing protein [Oscillospiraceae bacterium]|jgi:hypothetical protein|nr:DUF998 domain-containing protein [Oscillospiraceae bacterium]
MRKLYEKAAAILMFGGIIAFVAYIAYAAVGNALWAEYNPVTTDISSLSAVGAPNQAALAPLLAIYTACFLLFVTNYLVWSFYSGKSVAFKVGAILLFGMALVSSFGYRIFPLEGDKTQMTLQNAMHIVVTVAVVFLSIAALFLLAVGYRKTADGRRFGGALLAASAIFTLLGATNPIGMGAGLNILGLTERAAIYSLHLIIGAIGFREGRVMRQRRIEIN